MDNFPDPAMTINGLLALLAPLVLLASMLAAFKWFHARFGYPLGYLLGFCLYWIGWCLIFPAVILGGFGNILALFTPQPALSSLSITTQLLLWWPIAFPLFFMFIPRLPKANFPILLLSCLLGIVIGVTEEILWRGVYLSLFPNSLLLGVFYPSFLFGLWHICPQLILKNKLPGGVFSFIAYAFLLGLTYAFATRLTGSLFWPTISHIVHDTLGLGGFAYAAWLTKPKQVNPYTDIKNA